MENVGVLDLKKAIFYYLFSRRMILLCIAQCVALTVGSAYLRPVGKDVGMTEQEETALEEMRAKLITEDPLTKGRAAEIVALEKESFILENQLSSCFFRSIQINA
jgi:hypothetical protein